MAEMALSSLLRVVFQNLASPVMEEFGLLWGVSDELEKLSSTLSMIHAVLEDANGKLNQDKAVAVWLARLEEVAHDADDILDEFATEAKLQSAMAGPQSIRVNKVRKFLSSLHPWKVTFRRDIARRIKEIRKRLDDIGTDAMNLRLREGGHGGCMLELRRQPPTSSFLNESEIVGRQTDRDLIVGFLVLNQWIDNGVHVLPIVGIGGLGKTTLAQLVYNDTRVNARFDLKIWICVSENFDVTRLTKAIIESITLRPCESMELDALQNVLVRILWGRRYLLVLDDVWDDSNHAQHHWDVLRPPLTYGAGGSTIIVTTRSNIVASNMGTIPAYHLRGMSEEDCLLMFNQKAFAEGNPDAHPNLVKIGKQIVQKCSGLPLAAKTLGCLLNTKVDEDEWNVILKSDTWMLRSLEDGNGVLPALKLSYQHLPSHLKRCFVYCALFPKDYVFNRDKLVRLWMAEGFIHPEESEPMECVAQSYFDGLLKRSFFQYAYSYQHKQFVYTMHDLIHDLAQSISGDGYFRVQDDNLDKITKKIRHLSICEIEKRTFEGPHKAEKLRTFLLLHQRGGWFEKVPRKMFDKLKCLRVLGLNDIFHVKKLPSSIGYMKHLRYLDLSCTSLKSMPASICNLYNLQTLILHCTSLKKLPNSFGNLINLRYLDLSSTRLGRLPKSMCNLYDLHTLILKSSSIFELPSKTRDLVHLQHLNVDSCYELTSMPPGIGRLTSLRIFPAFVVGKDSGCGVGELNAMTNLQGKLHISKLENAIDLEESNLKDKQYIHELFLQWSYKYDSLRDGEAEKQLLETLQPHTNLNMLQIECYSGNDFPSWIGDPSFSYLTTLKFHECGQCKILPPLGQLPLLKYLEIQGMRGIRCVGHDFYGQGMVKGFPSLKTLSIYDMRNLEEWSGVEENEFPKLKKISIQLCNKLKELPYLPSGLTSMELSSCKELTSFPPLPDLVKLRLQSCDEKIFSSLPQLTSMVSLSIVCPWQLSSLPKELLQPLNALQKLELMDCRELFARSEWEGLQYLVSLKYLIIERSSCLTHLPEKGLCTTMEYLLVKDHKQLQALPRELKNLTSLQRLQIFGCPNLMSLTEEGLPATLKHLDITGCPLLGERYNKDRGEDWGKIAHIPHIQIDYKPLS